MKTIEEIRALAGTLPSPATPLVLLPVQVQTRYVGTQLLIRVYPDEIHVDSHQEGLTAAEGEWGRRYWELIWPAAGDVPAQRRAWDALVERFGARRAAWIARRLTPTNLAARPGTPPVFPDTGPARAADASPAPVARALPDRWIVMGYNVDGARTLLEAGAPIPETLVVGPGTDEPAGPPPAAGELPLDARMRWMVDFAEAEKVGMGIRVALPAATSYSALLVFGVKTTLTPDAAATRLETLLDAHHYTRGLALPAPGTPTNNTTDAASGYAQGDAGAFNVEVAPPKIGNGTDCGEVARLVGIRRDLFTAVEGATRLEDFTARKMNALLWAVTGGAYVEQMVTGLTNAEVDAARRFFIDCVRAQGPLPMLRVGRQPYGLLPATSLDLAGGRFVRTLQSLRTVWRRALANVPRLQPGADDELRLLEILRMQPYAAGHRVRLAFGGDALAPNVVTPGGLASDLQPHARMVRDALRPWSDQGIASATRLVDTLPAADSQPLVAPLAGPAPKAALNFLRTATFDDVLAERITGGPPATLLYALARHSVLLTQAMTGARVLMRRGTLPAAPLREPVLVDILGNDAPERTRTLARLLELDPALRASIHTLTPAQEPEATVLDELRQALAFLETQPATTLERHLAGCLDLFSHRLDPWITGLATRRLNDIRRSTPRGLGLGGFGWVHDVAPEPRTPVAPGPDGLPLYAAREPGGAIHAPSMGQAAAAAVLRSGYLTDNGDGSGQPFAIDLSSARVRVAQELLDGIRQGQALGDLLGYRFERGLHDRQLDRFVPLFRREARLWAVYTAQEWFLEVQTWPHSPFKIQALRSAQRALTNALNAVRTKHRWPAAAGLPELEALADVGVLDGLELARGLHDGRMLFDRPAATATQTQRTHLQAEVKNLENALDAVGDALTAEGVYQAVRGNFNRASASVDALAHGELQPPELEFVATPRAGAPVTHRLVVVFSATPPPLAGASPRAVAEPALELWLRQMHGDVRLVGYSAEFLDATGKVLLRRNRQPLGTLVPSPLDALYLSAASQPGAKSQLEQLIEYSLWRGAPATIPADARLRLVLERTSDLPASWLSLGEYLELVRAFREAILPARALAAADLAPASGDVADTADLTELAARADAAVAALRGARDRLAAPDDVRARLVDLAFFGFAEAIPAAPRDPSALGEQVTATLAEADRRVAAATAAGDPRDRLRAVFGEAFKVLPLQRPANIAELNSSLRRSDELQGGDPLQALSWLQGVSRVRAGASRLDAALMYAAALDRSPALELKVAQLPFIAGERWVGLSGAPVRGKLSLVAHMPRPFQVSAPLSGLVIDEWTESVPSGEVTTGVAFNFDAPGARPPQSVVLAVTPPGAQRWDVDTIEKTLLETFELARLRAVDPQALGGEALMQRALPALYVSANLAGDTVSTDFARLL